jgi:hypothetical protein
MYKKDALCATLLKLNSLEKLHYKSRDSGVYNVSEHSSGKCGVTVFPGASIGSNYGSQRVALSDYYPNYLATVNQNLMALRITGLNKSQRSILIIIQ